MGLSIVISPKFLLLLQVSDWGVSSYIAVHCYKYVEKHQRGVQKSICVHLKLTGKHAFG